MSESQSEVEFERFLERGDTRRPLAGSILLFAVVGFLVIAFIWAAVTELDEVTRGQGKVVPSRNLQVIQSMEGGVLAELHAREGDRVTEGDILMVLGGGMVEGNYRENLQRYHGLQARIERLAAEANQTELVFSPEVTMNAPDVARAETQLYRARQDELDSELRVLDQQLSQRRQELEELRATAETARESIDLAQSELELIEPLVERGLESELTLLQIRRTLNEQRGELSRSRSGVERAQAAIQEIQERRTSARDAFVSRALSELSEATGKAAELEAILPAQAEQVARTNIRSPVDGIVNRMHLTTIGGVARPGDPLVEVVPLDENLRIEAHIKPSDIAFLYPGQPVRVKLTAYDFARYGGLDGELTVIGADAVEMPESEELMYPVQVETSGQLYGADGEPLEIIPGMVAEVEILSGKRTVLDYLLEPVVKIRDRALRD